MEHDEGADKLEAQADDMQQGSEQLGERIENARSDWKSKQSDESTPGAIEPDAARPGGPGSSAGDSEEDAEDKDDDSAGGDDDGEEKSDGDAGKSGDEEHDKSSKDHSAVGESKDDSDTAGEEE